MFFFKVYKIGLSSITIACDEKKINPDQDTTIFQKQHIKYSSEKVVQKKKRLKIDQVVFHVK